MCVCVCVCVCVCAVCCVCASIRHCVCVCVCVCPIPNSSLLWNGIFRCGSHQRLLLLMLTVEQVPNTAQPDHLNASLHTGGFKLHFVEMCESKKSIETAQKSWKPC